MTMANDEPPPDDDRIWRTKDGREIPFDKMETAHIRNARAVITPWSKGERDEEKRGELRSWRKTFASELRKRATTDDKDDAGNGASARSTAAAEREAKFKAGQKARAAEQRARHNEMMRERRKAERIELKAAKSAGKPRFGRPAAAGAADDAPPSKSRGSFQRPSTRPRRAPDHWSSVLGIADDASANDIERAFREQAKLAHPDAGGSAAAMRQLIIARDWAMRERGGGGDVE